MATDPIRRVRHTEYDIPLTFGIREALDRLAGLPPSQDVPFLTVCLDWTPDGANPGRDQEPVVLRSQRRGNQDNKGEQQRPSRTVMEQELGRLIDEYGPRGAIFDSLRADAERIADFIDEELDPSAKGVYIVSNSANGVFETLALGLPLETSIRIGPMPMLSSLAKKVDDHPAYMVLLADQREATLSVIRRARQGRTVWLDSSDYPPRTQQGGPSQRRYQARHDERVSAFARDVADATLQALQEEGVDMLILAGDEVITSALMPEFHHGVTDRIVDTIRLDIRASEQELLDATLPIVAAAERERELEKVERIANAVGAAGRGAAGGVDVLRALQRGQAAGIAMVDDYAEPGWADFGRNLYGVGPVPERHPMDGDVADLVPIPLEEEMIRLAVQTGATIEIVKTTVPVDAADAEVPDAGSLPRSEAAGRLDAIGGVGATLRYT